MMTQQETYDPLNPNVYVLKDPKSILAELEVYALKNNLMCKYKKNTHRIDFSIPISNG